MPTRLDRRQFIAGAAAGSALVGLAGPAGAQSRDRYTHGVTAPGGLAATRPAGFTPFTAPGRVVRVNMPGSLRTGGLFPRPEAARQMIERGLRELTGARDLASAWRQFVHPSDVVGIKPNGIASRVFASAKEVIVPIIEGVMAAGVPADRIVVWEQYNGFLAATRLTRRDVPSGVQMLVHTNTVMGPDTRVPSGRTGYASALLQCTAVINVPLVKDHSLSGFTGAMKNMTHGSIRNPSAFHQHHCSPQIAELYSHEAIRSRVRLIITDAFKVMYDGGPLNHNPDAQVPLEAMMFSTDPVATDRIGAEIVDEFRTRNHMLTLDRRGTPPAYIDHAAQLGLGIGERSRIDLVNVRLA